MKAEQVGSEDASSWEEPVKGSKWIESWQFPSQSPDGTTAWRVPSSLMWVMSLFAPPVRQGGPVIIIPML